MKDKYIPKHCLYCDLIEHEGLFYEKDVFVKMFKDKPYSSGIDNNITCHLLAAYEMASYDDDVASLILEDMQD